MSNHLISTRSSGHTCRRCAAAVYSGWAEGLLTVVDAEPLTDEIAALLEGRWTYTRTPAGELVHRDAGRITGGTLRGTVHAEHRCTATLFCGDSP